MTVERTFPRTAASVTEARHYALAAIGNAPRSVAETVGIAVSELATNCVRYADTDYTVKVDLTEDRVRIEVTDGCADMPTIRSPGPAEPSGRGLLLVRQLSDEWGVDAAVDHPGKTVWFTVQLSDRPGAALQDAG